MSVETKLDIVEDLNLATEEDAARLDDKNVKAIVPEVPPTAEEIEAMEKVEVLEEDKAEADFPSNESNGEEPAKDGSKEDTQDVETVSSNGVSESNENVSSDPELEEALKKFDELTISVEDVKKSISENKEFPKLDLSDDDIQNIIDVYLKVIKDDTANVTTLLTAGLKEKFLIQASKDGVNTSNAKELEFYIEGLIREACTNAFMDKGKALLDETVKKATSKLDEDISIDEYIEASHNDRIEKMKQVLSDEQSSDKVKAFAKSVIKALNDSTDYSDIYEFLKLHNSYFNALRAFKHQEYYRREIMSALQSIGVKTANVAAIIDAIGRFNHNPDNTVVVNAILLRVIYTNTNFKNKVDLLKLYSFIMNLSAAIHVYETKDEVNDFYKQIIFNFQQLVAYIDKGFIEWDKTAHTVKPEKKTKKRK